MSGDVRVTDWRQHTTNEKDLHEWAEKRADDAGRLARQLLRERSNLNGTLREALDWSIAEIEGRTRYDNDTQRDNALQLAKEALITTQQPPSSGIDPRMYHLHVEALSEIKATVDGESDQPVKDIICGLLDEIKALPKMDQTDSGLVPISEDGRHVFIDGHGMVPLAFPPSSGNVDGEAVAYGEQIGGKFVSVRTTKSKYCDIPLYSAQTVERLRREVAGLRAMDNVERRRAERAEAALAEAEKERDALREALTPSGETKAEYIGEFSFKLPYTDDDGNHVVTSVTVPWDTTKEIMAAIRSRATIRATREGTDDVA